MTSQPEIRIALPDDFPLKYRDAVLRVMEQCTVRRAIAAQPEVRARVLAQGTALASANQ